MVDAAGAWNAILGGAMIGAAAVALMASHGRIAGISGILARLLPPDRDGEASGRLGFLGGLAVAPFVLALLTGTLPSPSLPASTPMLLVAGGLVGFGSVWGNGCTSGHGVCGLARLSRRSLIATLIFLATAFATVFVVRHVV